MEVGPGWDLAFVPLGLLGEGGYVEGGIDHRSKQSLRAGQAEINTVVSFPQVKQINTSQQWKQKALLFMPKSRNQG